MNKNIQIIVKGLSFGMLLQLAIGPICLLVFNTATTEGVFKAMEVVFAVSIIDLLFISLSLLGISFIFNKKNLMYFFNIFSGLILIIIGLNLVLSVFDISLIHNIQFLRNLFKDNFFLIGIILTLSNPLTIIFWSSVFSKNVADNGYTKTNLIFFAMGCILATFLFLSFISILGIYFNRFLSNNIVSILNIIIGLLIIFFGFKMLVRKKINGLD